MASCASCGEANPDRARFCLACGAALAGPGVRGRRTRRTVTILFCDLSGSTALGERLDPEALRSLMEAYYGVAREALEGHGGTVEKFIGDAVMAVFGATETHEDDALRAVRAAVELRDRLATPGGEGLLAAGPDGLPVRIGVSTGEVIVGDPGTGEAFATGDAVNVAARLEQTAAPGEILISEATRRLVVDAVATEPLPPLELRGKREPVAAHRLLQVVPDAPGRSRRLDLPLVGRARERRLLEEAFARTVADRTPQLFTILGAAGVGKSRLVHEIELGIRTRARVLHGRCLPYGTGITYWPLAEIVREAAGIRAADRQGTALRRLDRLLEPEGDERPLIRRLLAGAIGLSAGGGSPEETAWAVRRLFARLASERPLVIVVDDIHWGAPALLELLEGLLDRVREVPLLILCQGRPELLETRPTWAGGKLNATSILLEPLTADECGTLTGELLAGGAVPADVIRRVGEASEGNPLFVEEFVAMLIDDGRLRREGPAWVTVGSLDALEVPPTVSALLGARLDRLDEGERRVLEIASVQGRGFSRVALEALSAPADRAALPARLAALVRKELVRPEAGGAFGDETFRFRHILLRDAAYAHLPKEDRAGVHEEFATWLIEAAGDRLEEYEEIVGYHLEQAWGYRREVRPSDPTLPALATQAAARLASAGRRAQGRGDLVGAVGLLARAAALEPLAPSQLARILVDLGAAHGDRGDFEAAAASLRRARAL
ncbi:MAG: AAA family ATPase, partial [Candidatus Limnocylindrales bacterium]